MQKLLNLKQVEDIKDVCLLKLGTHRVFKRVTGTF